jgi:phosphoribosyl 1,2-cyclic phosphate phosphodiesterase
MGFDDLRRFSTRNGGKFPVYGSPETLAVIKNAFGFAFMEDAPRYYLRPEARLIDGPFSLGELLVTPLQLPHGNFTSNGFLLSRGERRLFAYCNDCSDVPEIEREKIRGVEVLALDGLRHEPHYSHMTVEKALQVAIDVSSRKTYLTHISDYLKHEETEAQLPRNVHLAYDGLRVGWNGS